LPEFTHRDRWGARRIVHLTRRKENYCMHPSHFTGHEDSFDPATHVPRTGKSIWRAETDLTSFASKEVDAGSIIGNCTTVIRFESELDVKANGHTFVFGTTRQGRRAKLDCVQGSYASAGGTTKVVDVSVSKSGGSDHE
jgi:hypothetical protein